MVMGGADWGNPKPLATLGFEVLPTRAEAVPHYSLCSSAGCNQFLLKGLRSCKNRLVGGSVQKKALAVFLADDGLLHGCLSHTSQSH